MSSSKRSAIFQRASSTLERKFFFASVATVAAAAIGACSDPPTLEGSTAGGGTGAGTTGGATTGGSGAASGANAGGTSSGAGGAATGGAATGGAATGGAATGGNGAGAGSGGAGAVPTGGAAGASSGSGGTAPGGSGPGGTAGTTAGGTGVGGAGAGGAGGRGGAGSGGSGIAGGGGTAPGDRGTPEGVCARWNADRMNVSEGTWSGSVASCMAGDISADGRANALRLFNLYRWLADLPAVATEASRDAQAQACALMQQANRSQGLSHDPPNTWMCWTQLGADGSARSNISSGPGVSSVDGYMIDNGNETTFGHRRIVLSNELGPIGLGSTGPSGASCMQNIGGTGRAGKTWMAWPAPGIIPLQAIRRSTNSSLDRTGWSIQSNTLNLASGTVSVTAGGTNQPVTVSALTGSYGGTRYAIRIVPNGWTTTAGQTYTVSVSGLTTPLSYDVRVVDCAL